MFQMCYYTDMLVFLSACLSCLLVSQFSMDDSSYKGNTGQLLNSIILGVMKVITLFMTQVSVCQSQSKLHSVHTPLSARGLSLQLSIKKGGS